MTGVGVIGILLCVGALPFFPPARQSQGFLLFLGLLLAHLGASIGFYFYALSTSSDAALYYYDTHGLRRYDLALGTIFVIKLVQTLKAYLGGSYLDYFLVFQAFGFWGVLMLQRCFEAVQNRFGAGYFRAPYWLLFLPGIHFWTGAIGKDAPLFFAITLALWSVLKLATRMPWFVLAIFIMALFRPHIAVLAMAALAGSAFFGSRSGIVAKGALVIVAVAGLAIVGMTVDSSLGVSFTDPGSFGSYLEKQQNNRSWVQGASGLQDSPFLFRLFSLLFRPLFLDANGIFGLIASAENLVFIYVVGFMLRNWRIGLELFRSEIFLRFALMFALLLILLLTMTYYNVGLGIRQKMMAIPGLFTFFVAVWLTHRSRMATLAAGAAPGNHDMRRPAGERVEGLATRPSRGPVLREQ